MGKTLYGTNKWSQPGGRRTSLPSFTGFSGQVEWTPPEGGTGSQACSQQLSSGSSHAAIGRKSQIIVQPVDAPFDAPAKTCHTQILADIVTDPALSPVVETGTDGTEPLGNKIAPVAAVADLPGPVKMDDLTTGVPVCTFALGEARHDPIQDGRIGAMRHST